MAILGKWITQIIVLMLIGTIVELLLPNNQMKKYVNLVLGLLLLLILTQPILYVFSVDVTNMISKVETSLFQDDTLLLDTEKSVEIQKDDIQATQDAYIWNEISSQLKLAANETLQEEYSLQIVDIAIEPTDSEEELGIITCTINEIAENGAEADNTVPPIVIEIGHEHEQPEADERVQAISQELASIWDVDPSQIHIQWEGQID